MGRLKRGQDRTLNIFTEYFSILVYCYLLVNVEIYNFEFDCAGVSVSHSRLPTMSSEALLTEALKMIADDGAEDGDEDETDVEDGGRETGDEDDDGTVKKRSKSHKHKKSKKKKHKKEKKRKREKEREEYDSEDDRQKS